MRWREHAFTLIELLMVVLIVGILASIAIPTYRGAGGRAADAGAQTLVRVAVDSANAYWYATGGSFSGLSARELAEMESGLPRRVVPEPPFAGASVGDWTAWGGGATVSVEPGDGSLRVQTVGPGQGARYRRGPSTVDPSQMLPVSPGRWTLQYQARGDIAGERLVTKALAYDASGASTLNAGNSDRPPLTADYQQTTWTFDVPASSVAAFLELRRASSASGPLTFWVNDITLTRAGGVIEPVELAADVAPRTQTSGGDRRVFVSDGSDASGPDPAAGAAPVYLCAVAYRGRRVYCASSAAPTDGWRYAVADGALPDRDTPGKVARPDGPVAFTPDGW